MGWDLSSPGCTPLLTPCQLEKPPETKAGIVDGWEGRDFEGFGD